MPVGEVIAAARDLARRIAVNAPLSLRESLRIARMAFDLSDDELRKRSNEAARTIMASEDAKEGPRAFLEKRAPNWAGR